MNKKAIIVDLDGTLCNIEHRMPFFRAKRWPEFHAEMIYDRPFKWCVNLIRSMAKDDYTILFVTARSDIYRKETIAWLTENIPTRTLINCEPPYMKKGLDPRGDAIIKAEIYKNEIEPAFRVEFCVDDRQTSVDGWRKLGLTCLQCAKGDY